jgi:hypothetical protein
MAELAYLRAFIDSFGLVGLKTAQRFRDALTGAEGATYTFEQASSDTFGFYDDLLAAWFRLASPASVFPTSSVTMKMTEGSADATATVPIALSAVTLESTDLLKIGLPAVPKIPKTDVTLTLTGTNLEIKVKNLAARKAGLFKGLVFDKATSDPVIEIRLLIVP